MAEKVLSFQTGGALWFTDLTSPDSLYLLPDITGLTFLITVECNAQEGMEGNPMANTVKNVCRGFAVLTVPMSMTFPYAIFCYWITSNLFSLTYGLDTEWNRNVSWYCVAVFVLLPNPYFLRPWILITTVHLVYVFQYFDKDGSGYKEG